MKRQPAQLEGRHPMKSAVSAGGLRKSYGRPLADHNFSTTSLESCYAPFHSHLENASRLPQLSQDLLLLLL